MSLFPHLEAGEITLVEESQTVQPTKTYRFDVATGKLSNELIDDREALEQFIIKAVSTPRFRFLIYSDNYGCEIEDIIGENVTHEFIESEVYRMVKEALVYDDRIQQVTNINVTKDKDVLTVSFRTITTDGYEIDSEVTYV